MVGKPRNPGYLPGDHWGVCDVCGLVYRQQDLRLRWDNAVVCKYDWEPRHPQDFLRARNEDPSAKGLVRPEPEGKFLESRSEWDRLYINDIAKRIAKYNRSNIDTFGISDFLNPFDIVKNLIDYPTIADPFDRIVYYRRRFIEKSDNDFCGLPEDYGSVTDTSDVTIDYGLITDPATQFCSFGRIAGLSIFDTPSLLYSKNILSTKDYNNCGLPKDYGSVTESANQIIDYGYVTDTATVFCSFGEFYTVNVSDIFSRTAIFSRSFSDNPVISDSPNRIWDLSRDYLDTFYTSDSESKLTKKIKLDTFSVSDSRDKSIKKTGSDTSSTSDTFSRSIVFNRSYINTSSVSDSVTLYKNGTEV